MAGNARDHKSFGIFQAASFWFSVFITPGIRAYPEIGRMQITQSDFVPGRTRVGKGNSIERSQSDHLWVLRLWQAKAVGYDVKYASELRVDYFGIVS